MTPDDAALIARLCAERAGLSVDPEKTYSLESRLEPVARRHGFAGLDALMQQVRPLADDALVWAVVEAMSQADTAFFRDRIPFIDFETQVLPALAERRREEPIRIWSAACGAGQEVYSLAMILDEQGPALGSATVELFGSDLSTRALERAQAGRYSQFEIQRGLPIRRLVRHFELEDDAWVVRPELRRMIRWRRVNLVADVPAAGRFDVIFCRYALAQTRPEARPRLISNLTRALKPDGYLALGLGESLGEDRDGAFTPSSSFWVRPARAQAAA